MQVAAWGRRVGVPTVKSDVDGPRMSVVSAMMFLCRRFRSRKPAPPTLAHAEGKDELMYRANDGSLTDFSDGDRAGLALLGNGPCVPEY